MLWTIFNNVTTKLVARGIKTGFSFLEDVAPFSIPLNFSPFWDFELGTSVYWDVFVIGIQNTAIVSALGIPTALLLGILIGILRLSPNWLMRALSSVYIEVFRNTPLLLQLLMWTFAVFPPLFNQLPIASESIVIGSGIVLNNAGIYLPLLVFSNTSWILFGAFSIGTIVLIYRIKHWARKRQFNTGQTFPMFTVSLLIIFVALVVFYFVARSSFMIDLPVKRGLNYSGGMRPPFQLIILWLGLTVYTAAFIAENVRGGIVSVNAGQSEAGMSLGISRMMRLRLIILPQALRVIIPPTISQFLNLIKNSSLAVAIGYPDLTNIWAGIALNQTGQSVIIIAMTIAVYEILSLSIAALTNWYNAKTQITER